MKVRRRYIPIPVRVAVAERQLMEMTGCSPTDELGVPLILTVVSNQRRLDAALFHLSGGGTVKLELHHRPALENRPWNARKKDYDPPANDPGHLFYVTKPGHKVETYVRGVRGQLSDAGLRRKLKRMAKNRDPKRRVAKIPQRKNPWPKGRKLRGRR